jgi:serine/threonine protein phosphatase PrpC
MAGDMLRSPTFLVGTEKQRGLLDEFQRRDQHFTEEYQKNKPLCFSARAYQKTHPGKMKNGHKDADATLASPMLLGVADGVSQLEEFGMDASELPNELLRTCEELGMSQLIPGRPVNPQDAYRGPVSLLKEAYEETESLGSTTVLLAILDNSTKIHGKLHPMVAVLTIGDCELLMLRRLHGRQSPLQAVFHTEMQRIDGHVQTPLQLARVDERVDPEFDEELALEVIERGSAVHCVSAYEGDIIVLGSDGVFDNLFLDEVVDICNEALPAPKPGTFVPTQPALLSQIAKRVVEESHSKSKVGKSGHLPETPIGRGGKMDDTSVVVGEVVEWTQAHSEVWAQVRRQRQWRSVVTCGGIDGTCRSCHKAEDSGDDYEVDLRRPNSHRNDHVHPPGSSRERHSYPQSGVDSDGEDDKEQCSIL